MWERFIIWQDLRVRADSNRPSLSPMLLPRDQAMAGGIGSLFVLNPDAKGGRANLQLADNGFIPTRLYLEIKHLTVCVSMRRETTKT